MIKKLINELVFEEDAISGNNNKSILSKNTGKNNNSNDSNISKDFFYKYSNDNIYYKSEIALWKAVILQAMIDLQSNSRKKIANTYRIKALMWFNLKNDEFLTVCSYAGLNPHYVHEKAMKVKANNRFLN